MTTLERVYKRIMTRTRSEICLSVTQMANKRAHLKIIYVALSWRLQSVKYILGRNVTAVKFFSSSYSERVSEQLYIQMIHGEAYKKGLK